MSASFALHSPNKTFQITSRKIPVTLQDGEEFGRGEKFYHFACFSDEGAEGPEKTTDVKSIN